MRRRSIDGCWQIGTRRVSPCRILVDDFQINVRLQADLERARDRLTERDRDLLSVQGALQSLEDERRKLGDEQTSDRSSLELEMNRVKRDLTAAKDELKRARGEVDGSEEKLRQRDLERAQLLEKLRDLEARLASERQGRLNLSDKLDSANKNWRQHERDAVALRERIEELEPLLTETQQERFQLERQSEQQRQERSELLLRVFKDVNKFLGTDDHATPANFAVFRDTLLHRLRAINGVRSDFEKRVRETEASVEHRMAALKKQLEQKWRTLDNFEASVKKLETTRMQWRSKYSIKDGELEAAKVSSYVRAPFPRPSSQLPVFSPSSHPSPREPNPVTPCIYSSPALRVVIPSKIPVPLRTLPETSKYSSRTS